MGRSSFFLKNKNCGGKKSVKSGKKWGIVVDYVYKVVMKDVNGRIQSFAGCERSRDFTG